MAGDQASGWIPFFFIPARRVPRSREGLALAQWCRGYHLFDISSVDYMSLLKTIRVNGDFCIFLSKPSQFSLIPKRQHL